MVCLTLLRVCFRELPERNANFKANVTVINFTSFIQKCCFFMIVPPFIKPAAGGVLIQIICVLEVLMLRPVVVVGDKDG